LVEKLLSGLKFLLFVLLLPLIFAMTTGFMNELFLLDPVQSNCFLWGIVGYLVFHLFIAEPYGMYQYGKILIGNIFKFFAPLVVVAPLVVPIFSIFFLILLYFAPYVFKNIDLSVYFLFFASFAFAMHMVFTARDLRQQDAETLKSHYFFSIALVYIVSLATMALMLHLSLSRFSFVHFIQITFHVSEEIYRAVFNQLFVPR
jgi:hypothetical protein